MRAQIKTEIVLASQSPRRQELLKLLFDTFLSDAPDVDETLPAGIRPEDGVMMLARRKAQVAAGRHPDALVIGADTVVSLGGAMIGKPVDADDAARMLAMLSGHTHQVYTGVALLMGMRSKTFCCATKVEMKPLTPGEIAWYISTGEPFDKAGAYGIQGLAARFIRRIDGDYFNVMGLPLNSLYENIGAFTK